MIRCNYRLALLRKMRRRCGRANRWPTSPPPKPRGFSLGSRNRSSIFSASGRLARLPCCRRWRVRRFSSASAPDSPGERQITTARRPLDPMRRAVRFSRVCFPVRPCLPASFRDWSGRPAPCGPPRVWLGMCPNNPKRFPPTLASVLNSLGTLPPTVRFAIDDLDAGRPSSFDHGSGGFSRRCTEHRGCVAFIKWLDRRAAPHRAAVGGG